MDNIKLHWTGDAELTSEASQRIVEDTSKQAFVVLKDGKTFVVTGGEVSSHSGSHSLELVSIIPAMNKASLGDKEFMADHGVSYPYMAGAMANGIASEELVIALGKRGYLGSFGSGGLRPERIEKAIIKIKTSLGDGPYCFNLLHSPGTGSLERQTIDLFLKHGVRTVEAAAFISLSPEIVYYRLKGIEKNADGSIVCKNKIIAKVSRIEVASRFMEPAPQKIVDKLLADGDISEEQALLSQKVPMADDITVEADSGGHTDNRPLVSLVPFIISARDEMQKKHRYEKPIRIGAAGGISTPLSALSAFMMGAAYVVSGSVNQSCVEAGTSIKTKSILANASMADVTMAPAADMFESGGKVQVLKKGTMFPMIARNLYELYSKHSSIDDLSTQDKKKLETRVFKQSMESVWNSTRDYWARTDLNILNKIEKNEKVKMAMIFRWYLGQSSRWAIEGSADRMMDMQIWCGQSMGAFNAWAKGGPFEMSENRKVADIADAIMEECIVEYRKQMRRG